MKKISLLVVLLLTCLAVTGCGRRNQVPDSDRQNIDGLPQWSVSHAPMSEQYEGAAIYDGKIYAYRYREGGISISVFSTDKVEQIESYDIPDVLEVYGENVQFIGYPTESGSGSAVLFSGDQLAINSGSEYQKEAWEFVKYFMQNGYHKSGSPVLKKQFDIVLKESLNEVLTNENGELSKVAKKSYREKDVINPHVFKCEQDDVKQSEPW